nr:hypothetical protein [uncultured Actinoplanes sp.]
MTLWLDRSQLRPGRGFAARLACDQRRSVVLPAAFLLNHRNCSDGLARKKIFIREIVIRLIRRSMNLSSPAGGSGSRPVNAGRSRLRNTTRSPIGGHGLCIEIGQ